MPSGKNKTGLFFGSFNPIHTGHMIIAEYFTEFTDLDELWFVVTPHNPLKKKKTLLDDSYRAEMVEIAITDNPLFRLCDAEFRLPKPSYTVHTLAYLKEKHPAKNFVLIMGSDNITTLNKWKNHNFILDEYQIYVYPRPEYPVSNIPDIFRKHQNVKIVEAPIIEISSSFIRDAIKKGKKLKYFLPEPVYKYICEKGFYLK